MYTILWVSPQPGSRSTKYHSLHCNLYIRTGRYFNITRAGVTVNGKWPGRGRTYWKPSARAYDRRRTGGRSWTGAPMTMVGFVVRVMALAPSRHVLGVRVWHWHDSSLYAPRTLTLSHTPHTTGTARHEVVFSSSSFCSPHLIRRFLSWSWQA